MNAPRVGCKSGRIPRTGLIFTILINHAPSKELVIYSEVIMSCFNHSLTDSLTLCTKQFGQTPPPPRQALSEVSIVWSWWSRECLYEGLSPSNPQTEILIFLSRPGFDPEDLRPLQQRTSNLSLPLYAHGQTPSPSWLSTFQV